MILGWTSKGRGNISTWLSWNLYPEGAALKGVGRLSTSARDSRIENDPLKRVSMRLRWSRIRQDMNGTGLGLVWNIHILSGSYSGGIMNGLDSLDSTGSRILCVQNMEA